MEQALHIFRKDVRHLWPVIVAVLLLTIFFAITPLHGAPVPMRSVMDPALFFASTLLPLAWWFLICSVIQQEALVGDRHFWLTRPYSRRSLVIAKALFVIAFVHVPFAISDIVQLYTCHISVIEHAPALLLRHFILHVVFILPAAALAVLTRSIPQFATGALVGFVAYMVGRRPQPFAFDTWLSDTGAWFLMLTVGVAVVGWQYRTRLTARGWAIACAGILLVPAVYALPSWRAEVALNSFFKRGPASLASISIAPDATQHLPKATDEPQGWVRVEFPMRVQGLPTGVELVVDGSDAAVVTASGTKQHFAPGAAAYVVHQAHSYRQGFRMTAYLYDQLKDQPLNLRITTALTVFSKDAPLSIRPVLDPFAVGDAGVCRIAENTGTVPVVTCATAFQNPPRMIVSYGHPPDHFWDRTFTSTTYSPFPVDAMLYPLRYRRFDILLNQIGVQTGLQKPREDARLTFTIERPLAHLVREVSIENVRLTDYRVPAGF